MNHTISKNILDNLLKIPKKDKGNERGVANSVIQPNVVHQADILYLPNDNSFKYLLVVIDTYSRKIEAEPLKNKLSQTVASSFGKIYKRGLLKIPFKIEVDSGSEFKGSTLTYFKKNNIRYRVALAGRHRQQSFVENTNKSIQKLIFYNQSARELLTGIQNREWVEDLPYILQTLNKRSEKIKHKEYKDMPLPSTKHPLLKIGSKVRVILDEPRNSLVDNKKYIERWRSTDIRWDLTPRTIMNILYKRGNPILYALSDKTDPKKMQNVYYTYNQLQLIPEKEEYPRADVYLKHKKDNIYYVEKILNMKMIKGKTFYKVHWRGFPSSDDTLESEQTLMEDVPKMLLQFNKTH